MSSDDRLTELADELGRLAESLTDAAMDLLREAVGAEDEEVRLEATRREKMLNRARAAVEKAARLTRQAGGDGPAREEG